MKNDSLSKEAVSNTKEKILLVDDNATNLQVLYQTLEGRGYNLLVAKSGETAFEIAQKAKPAIILLDIMMPPGIDGYETCRRLKSHAETKDSSVIFLSALDDTQDKVLGFSVGAVDFITKPFQGEEVLARTNTHLTVHRLKLELEKKNRELHHELKVAQNLIQDAYDKLTGPLLGESGAIKKLRQHIEHHIHSAETVLLIGSPGAGEEAVARAIHQQSERKNSPFIHVNCTAIKPDQHASLFGSLTRHDEKIPSGELGKFDLAGGGTLYLDSVNGLHPDLQTPLYKILMKIEQAAEEGKRFLPDIRVIAFTSCDLAEYSRKNLFNPDLYRLLSKRRLTIPELVERQEDIPVLADHFIQESARRLGKIVSGISADSMKRLKEFRWKGNIRELKNLLEHCVVDAETPVIDIDPGLLNADLIELQDIKLDTEKISQEIDDVLQGFDLPQRK